MYIPWYLRGAASSNEKTMSPVGIFIWSPFTLADIGEKTTPASRIQAFTADMGVLVLCTTDFDFALRYYWTALCTNMYQV